MAAPVATIATTSAHPYRLARRPGQRRIVPVVNSAPSRHASTEGHAGLEWLVAPCPATDSNYSPEPSGGSSIDHMVDAPIGSAPESVPGGWKSRSSLRDCLRVQLWRRTALFECLTDLQRHLGPGRQGGGDHRRARVLLTQSHSVAAMSVATRKSALMAMKSPHLWPREVRSSGHQMSSPLAEPST